jgi:hypothetical protein
VLCLCGIHSLTVRRTFANALRTASSGDFSSSPHHLNITLSLHPTGEYIFSPSGNNNSELENLLFDDNLQLVDVNDISVSRAFFFSILFSSTPSRPIPQYTYLSLLSRKSTNNSFSKSLISSPLPQDKGKENAESEESSEAKGEEKVDDLEAILENNLKLDFEPGKEDDDFLEDLNSSLSILLDEADNLDLLGDMMLQPPSSHFQHPRQPAQNYAHCVNSYRQSGYQVSHRDNF